MDMLLCRFGNEHDLRNVEYQALLKWGEFGLSACSALALSLLPFILTCLVSLTVTIVLFVCCPGQKC